MTDALLEDLPTIGPRLGDGLRAVGIADVAALHEVGATAARDRLRDAGLFDCGHSLAALEGRCWAFPSGRSTRRRASGSAVIGGPPAGSPSVGLARLRA